MKPKTERPLVSLEFHELLGHAVRTVCGPKPRGLVGRIGLTALMMLAAQQVAAQYSVSLQVDATSGTESYQTNIDPVMETSISASQLATSSPVGPPSGSGSASANATAAITSLSASSGATATGSGGATAVSETGFMDTVTLSVGSYQFGFAPAGGVSVNGGTNTTGVAFTEMSFEAAALTATGGLVSFTQDVCAEVINGSALASCGGGWQNAPTALVDTINVTAPGSYSIDGYFTSEATVNGGAVEYSCGLDACYDLYSITADAGDPAQFYINPLTSGASVLSASGASYAEPSPVPIPSAGWLMLSALGGMGSLMRKRLAAVLAS